MERLAVSSCSAVAVAIVDSSASRNLRPAAVAHRKCSLLPRVPSSDRAQEQRRSLGQLSAARFNPPSLLSRSTRRVHCNASADNADETGASDSNGDEKREGGGEEKAGEQEQTDKLSKDDENSAPPSEQEGTSEAVLSGDESDGDIMSGLGDWREFRARLIRGEVGGVAADDLSAFGPVGSLDGGDAVASSRSTAGDAPGVDDPSKSETDTETGAGSAAAAGSAADAEASVIPPLPSSSTSSPASSTLSSSSSSPSSLPSSSSPSLKSWAHPIAVPETGCVLLAHPRAFGVSQQYFNRAVIFLLMHGSQGTAGVILNRPSQYTLGQLAGFEELMPEFSACPLYLGGDVGSTSTHCLHGVSELVGGEGGAREVCPGVYVGGYSRIKAHVQSGGSNAMDYRWFARYAGWAPGQLEREVAAGVWHLGACSPDLILRHSFRDSYAVENDSGSISIEADNIEAADGGSGSSASSSGSRGGVGGGRGGVSVSGNTGLWREVMELMGGEFAQLCIKADGEL